MKFEKMNEKCWYHTSKISIVPLKISETAAEVLALNRAFTARRRLTISGYF